MSSSSVLLQQQRRSDIAYGIPLWSNVIRINVTCACITQRRDAILCGCDDGRLIVYRGPAKYLFRPFLIVYLFESGESVRCVCDVSYGNANYAVAATSSGLIRLFNIDDGNVIRSIATPNQVCHLISHRLIEAEHLSIFVITNSNTVAVLDVPTLNLRVSLVASEWISAMAVLKLSVEGKEKAKQQNIVVGVTRCGETCVWAISPIPEDARGQSIIASDSRQMSVFDCHQITCSPFNPRLALIICIEYWMVLDLASFVVIVKEEDKCDGEGGQTEKRLWRGGAWLSSNTIALWSETGRVSLFRLDKSGTIELKSGKSFDYGSNSAFVNDGQVLYCLNADGVAALDLTNDSSSFTETRHVRLSDEWRCDELLSSINYIACMTHNLAIGLADGRLLLTPIIQFVRRFIFDSANPARLALELIGSQDCAITNVIYPHLLNSAYSADMIVTGGEDGSVRVWSINNRRTMHRFTNHCESIVSIHALPPFESLTRLSCCLLVESIDTSASILNIQEHRSHLFIPSLNYRIKSIYWQTNQNLMLLALTNRRIHVYDIESASFERVIEEDESIVSIDNGTIVSHLQLVVAPARAAQPFIITKIDASLTMLEFQLDKIVSSLSTSVFHQQLATILLSSCHSWRLDDAVDESVRKYLEFTAPDPLTSPIILRDFLTAGSSLADQNSSLDYELRRIRMIFAPKWLEVTLRNVVKRMKSTSRNNNHSNPFAAQQVDASQYYGKVFWSLSSLVTSRQLIGILTISNAMIESVRLDEESLHAWVSLRQYYSLLLPDMVGHSYFPVDIVYLTNFYLHPNVWLRSAVHDLIITECRRMGSDGRRRVLKELELQLPVAHSSILTYQQLSAATCYRFSGDFALYVPFSLLSSDEAIESASQAITASAILVSKFHDLDEQGSMKYQLANLMCSILSCDSLPSLAPMRLAMLSLLAAGFNVFEHYLDPAQLLMSILRMCTDRSCYDAYQYEEADLHHLTVDSLTNIAVVRPKQFIVAMEKEIKRYTTSLATGQVDFALLLMLNIVEIPKERLDHQFAVLLRSKAIILGIVETLCDKCLTDVSDFLSQLIDIFVFCVDVKVLKERGLVELFPRISALNNIAHCKFSNILVVGGQAGVLSFYDLKVMSRLQQVNAHNSQSVSAVEFSPNGQHLATYSATQRKISFWYPASNSLFGSSSQVMKLLKTIPVPQVEHLQMLPGQQRLLNWPNNRSVILKTVEKQFNFNV